MHNGKMLLICPYTQIKICKYAQNMHKICSGPRSMSPLHYIHLHAKKKHEIHMQNTQNMHTPLC